MMLKYDIFYRESYTPNGPWPEAAEADLFVSAYNPSIRVTRVFENALAKEKKWLVHREYGFLDTEIPAGAYVDGGGDEADFIAGFFDQLAGYDLKTLSICVDITGFMRPHLMFLFRYLMHLGVKQLNVLYSEPVQYAERQKTTFAKGEVTSVRQVAGYEGHHSPDSTGSDLLIIGCGYEHDLISYVAEAKATAGKLQLQCFPALRPDFYQEATLREELATESVSPGSGGAQGEQLSPYLAPAYDPFETAAVLHDIVKGETERREVKNIYLSPVATRAQALGFALYYLYEWRGKAASVIYPFSAQYAQDTSIGLAQVWRYVVELPEENAIPSATP